MNSFTTIFNFQRVKKLERKRFQNSVYRPVPEIKFTSRMSNRNERLKKKSILDDEDLSEDYESWINHDVKFDLLSSKTKTTLRKLNSSSNLKTNTEPGESKSRWDLLKGKEGRNKVISLKKKIVPKTTISPNFVVGNTPPPNSNLDSSKNLINSPLSRVKTPAKSSVIANKPNDNISITQQPLPVLSKRSISPPRKGVSLEPMQKEDQHLPINNIHGVNPTRSMDASHYTRYQLLEELERERTLRKKLEEQLAITIEKYETELSRHRPLEDSITHSRVPLRGNLVPYSKTDLHVVEV
jgi:hypothetical protein